MPDVTTGTDDDRVASAPSPARPPITHPARASCPAHGCCRCRSIPLLLAAYPILVLFAQNQSEVGLGETVEPVTGAVVAACLITLVGGLLLRDLRRGAIIATSLVVVWFTFLQVQLVVRPLGVQPNVQVALSLGLVLLVGVPAWPGARPATVERLTIGLDVVALVLVGLTVVGIVPYQLDRPTPVAAIGRERTGRGRVPAPDSRDIYFLVFDRYGNHDSLADIADVDNDLPEWLDQQGFSVATDAHANYGRTTLSLAATLNMTYLDDVAAKAGPGLQRPKAGLRR